MLLQIYTLTDHHFLCFLIITISFHYYIITQIFIQTQNHLKNHYNFDCCDVFLKSHQSFFKQICLTVHLNKNLDLKFSYINFNLKSFRLENFVIELYQYF